MELNIKNTSSRVLLEKVDNGVILYEIGDDNTVTSKIVYEMYFKDGILDFDTIGAFMIEILESLKIPAEEIETNRQLGVFITKIDPTKPMIGEEDDDEDPEEL